MATVLRKRGNNNIFWVLGLLEALGGDLHFAVFDMRGVRGVPSVLPSKAPLLPPSMSMSKGGRLWGYPNSGQRMPKGKKGF